MDAAKNAIVTAVQRMSCISSPRSLAIFRKYGLWLYGKIELLSPVSACNSHTWAESEQRPPQAPAQQFHRASTTFSASADPCASRQSLLDSRYDELVQRARATSLLCLP